MKKCVLAILLLCLVGCGGGGGGGDSSNSDFRGGVYIGSIGLTSNSCWANDPPKYARVDLTVNQDDTIYVIDSRQNDRSASFNGYGTAVGGVSGTDSYVSGNCTIDQDWIISGIESDSATVTLNFTAQCPGYNCGARWSGSVTRIAE